VWQEGGQFVGLLMAVGAVALAVLAWWLVTRKRAGKVTLLDPDLFRIKNFRVGALAMVLQQITIGGAMIALPLYLQVTLEYNAMQAGLSLAPLSLTMFAVALLAGKKAGERRPAAIIRLGFALALVGMVAIIPVIPVGESGWALLVPLLVAGSGLGLLVSQLNNYILGPIEEERVSEAAGVNSAGQSFGLSFGLAMAGGILLATLSFSFVDLTESSEVIPPEDQELIATALEDNAQLVSTSQLEELLADQPDEVAQEIIDINSAAGDRALQVAMLVPVLACLLGLANSFRMMRLPDFTPSAAAEGVLGG
jgi:Na+/melibiose symporter-like transporter